MYAGTAAAGRNAARAYAAPIVTAAWLDGKRPNRSSNSDRPFSNEVSGNGPGRAMTSFITDVTAPVSATVKSTAIPARQRRDRLATTPRAISTSATPDGKAAPRSWDTRSVSQVRNG